MDQRRLEFGLAHMAERVRQLGLLFRPQVQRQGQLSGVEKPVVGAAERDHALGRLAAAETLGNQVRRVDPVATTDQAGLLDHLHPLLR